MLDAERSTPGSKDLAGIQERLHARGGELGRALHFFDEVTSTNDLAKAAAHAGAEHGTVWLAERQTRGRGRQGRAWLSPAGEGLWVSVLMRLQCQPSRLPPLSLVTGLAVRDAISSATQVEPLVKWPNDVLLAGRKVAGCLVEAHLSGMRVEALIVGIGINVHTRVFPDDLAGRATSVALHARDGLAPDRGALLLALLEHLERDITLAAARGLGPLASRLASVDALRGQRVREASREGVAEGIDEEGRLCVRADDGALHRLSAGEVHLASSVLDGAR